MSQDSLLELLRNDRATLSQDRCATGSASGALDCVTRLQVIPLRYAVVGTDDPSAQAALPTLPATLARDLPPLSKARYAVRPLREGYLYRVYLWSGQWHIDAYQVNAEGRIRHFDPRHPPPKDALESLHQAMASQGGHALDFQRADEYEEVRFLFTPDALTPAMMESYRRDPALRGTLQPFNLRALAYSCQQVDDVLPPSTVTGTVADFAARPRSAKGPEQEKNARALSDALSRQLFASPSWAGSDAVEALLGLHRPPDPKHPVIAVVLNDALGITQELNAWRNDSINTIEQFLGTHDKEGISNRRKFTIGFALDNLEKTLGEQAELAYNENFNTVAPTFDEAPWNAGNAQAAMMSSGNIRRFRNPAQMEAVRRAEIAQARSKAWSERYAPKVDDQRRDAFRNEFAGIVAQADALNQARSGDHLRWCRHVALMKACRAYDRDSGHSGVAFEGQMGKALCGMDSTAEGRAQLDTWSDAATVAEDNLLLRALAANQQQAQATLDEILAQRDAFTDITEDRARELTKGFSDIFDKMHAFVDEVEKGAAIGVAPVRVSEGVLFINTVGNRLLRNRGAAVADAAVNTMLAWLLKARLGKLAQEYRLVERGGRALGSGAQARLDRAAGRSFAQALAQGVKGPMAEVRLGAVLTALEMWNFKIKAEKSDKGSRDYFECMAALAGIGAAGMELGAIAVGFAEGSTNATLRQAAGAFKGGLRLTAGVFAGAAASVGAVFDLSDSYGAISRKDLTLGGAYFIRATLQMGTAVLVFGIGLGAAGPAIEYLLQKHGRSFLARQLLLLMQTGAEWAASRMVWMLRWGFRLNIVMVVVTVAIWQWADDALQTYLDHSTFRKDRSNRVADTLEKEVEILQKAVEEVLG